MIKEKIVNLKGYDEILLVIDYDRTLVNNSKEVMTETRSALIEFQKRGGRIALASGRPKSGLDKVSEKLNVDKYKGYIIGANGAEVYSYEDNKRLCTNNISVNDLAEALKTLNTVDVCKGIYTEEALLVSGYTDDLADEAKSNCLRLEVTELKEPLSESSKIILSKTRETTHNYYEEVCELLKLDLNIVKSSPRYIEITSKKADKGLGINEVLKNNPNLKCVIGIGDSQNDLSMLLHSDIKIAMGNSTEGIKEISDIVIGTNEEDGIGHFMSEYVL